MGATEEIFSRAHFSVYWTGRVTCFCASSFRFLSFSSALRACAARLGSGRTKQSLRTVCTTDWPESAVESFPAKSSFFLSTVFFTSLSIFLLMFMNNFASLHAPEIS